MLFRTVDTSQIAEDSIETEYGTVSHIKNCFLYSGIYITKDKAIPLASTNEFFKDPAWRRKWKKHAGECFGGKNDNDLCFVGDMINLNASEQGKEVISINEPVYLFQYQWDFNYHHFLVSSMSRLSGFEEISKMCPEVKILIRTSTPNYQREFIEYLYGKEHILLLDDHYVFYLDSIYVMDFIANDAAKLVKYYGGISSKLILEMTTFSSDYENIYISRKDSAEKRPMRNENEFSKLIESKGYEEVVLSRFSIIDKAKMFSDAKRIVTSFGAGVANILFCRDCKYLIFVEHPVYLMPSIYSDICRINNIDVLRINSRTFYWYALMMVYKILVILGYKNHEWSNPFSWSTPLRKLKNALALTKPR